MGINRNSSMQTQRHVSGVLAQCDTSSIYTNASVNVHDTLYMDTHIYMDSEIPEWEANWDDHWELRPVQARLKGQDVRPPRIYLREDLR